MNKLDKINCKGNTIISVQNRILTEFFNDDHENVSKFLEIKRFYQMLKGDENLQFQLEHCWKWEHVCLAHIQSTFISPAYVKLDSQQCNRVQNPSHAVRNVTMWIPELKISLVSTTITVRSKGGDDCEINACLYLLRK